MRALCVIPARIGSTRLPNKPLQVIGGQPLVSFVTHRILQFKLFDHVVLATDSLEIRAAVEHLPVEVVMTSTRHRCGTERVAEVVANQPHQITVNVQGDEAFIGANAISGVIELLEAGANLVTAATDLTPNQRFDRHTTKVAVGTDGRAVGFDRSVNGLAAGDEWVGRHVGIYGYQRDALLKWASAKQTTKEITLGLEQLRPISYGEPIHVARLEGTGITGIDTPLDLEAAESYMTGSTEQVPV